MARFDCHTVKAEELCSLESNHAFKLTTAGNLAGFALWFDCLFEVCANNRGGAAGTRKGGIDGRGRRLPRGQRRRRGARRVAQAAAASLRKKLLRRNSKKMFSLRFQTSQMNTLWAAVLVVRPSGVRLACPIGCPIDLAFCFEHFRAT